MIPLTSRSLIGRVVGLIVLIGITTIAGSSILAQTSIPNNQISFDRPEAWALKRFDAALLPSMMLPVAPVELRHAGTISVGVQMGWLPMLSVAQETVGFDGTKLEDLNEAPVVIEPVIGVQLPWSFKAYVTAPPPISTFGIKPRFAAFGLERPLLEREPWTLDWQAYGQVGSVKGPFTCPESGAPAFPPGDGPLSSVDCTGKSADIASLNYVGTQLQVAYSLPQLPKLVPHASIAGTFDDVAFQSHAPTAAGLSQTRQWARGGMFSTAGGASYLFTPRIALTVDVFYAPLEVSRTAGAPVTNDGLFNVRGLLSYSFGSAAKQH
jgi:hypothetical protein